MSLYEIIVTLHVVSAAVGVGAAATSDTIFLRSIRNRNISRDQFVLIRAASRVVFGGLILLTLTGIYMMFVNTGLVRMSHFQVKMTAVLILMVNGLIFHAKLLPFFKQNMDVKLSKEDISSRQWLFAITGAVSAVSWFAALIIAVMGDTGIGYLLMSGIYIALMIGGSITAYFILEHLIFWSQRARQETSGKSSATGLILQIILLVILIVSLIIVAFNH
jgi:hypothetical protein